MAAGQERSASGSGIARPVATSYGDMTNAMMTEMAAQLARMGQLAIDVENLKPRSWRRSTGWVSRNLPTRNLPTRFAG